MQIEIYNAGDYPMVVRAGSEWDRGIIHECQNVYWWDMVGEIHTAIDVGAHIGGWTRYAKWLHPNAIIAAIEVEPDNQSLLRQNVGLLDGVTIYPARCGYAAGEWAIAKAVSNTGGNIVVRRGAQVMGDYEVIGHEVETVTLEQVMADMNLLSIDVLKLDCEGAEVDILNHMANDTLYSVRHIVGEIHFQLADFARLTGDRLERAFNVQYVPTSSDSLWHFYAKNKLHE